MVATTTGNRSFYRFIDDSTPICPFYSSSPKKANSVWNSDNPVIQRETDKTQDSADSSFESGKTTQHLR